MTDSAAPGDTPLRVVAIGAGYFSHLHVEAWRRDARVQFAGLCDTDTAKAEALLKAIGVPDGEVPVFSDAEQMLAALKPDVVDIVTPPPAHAGLIELAIAHAPTVICQKPFCGDLATARQVAQTIAASPATVIVHENFRFQPWYRVIREQLDAGALGDIYQISFRLRPGDGQGPDAYLSRQPYFQTMPRLLIHETAVHWIDTFRYLLGEPDSLLADLRRLNPAVTGEDAGMFVFRYADGRRAMFDGNRLADHAADDARLTMGECLVEGSKATIELDGFGRLWRREKGESQRRPIPTSYRTDTFGGDCVYALQRHVVDGVLHGTALENTVSAYLRNMEVEETVYAAAEAGQVVALA